MRIKILTSLLTCLGASPVSAQDIQSCLAIQEPESRLACYDSESGYVAQTQAQPDEEAGATATSRWQYIDKQDGFTNADTSYVMLQSDKASLTMTDAPIAMIFRCDGRGGTDIYVISGGYIGSRNDRVPVRYKFQGGEPISERWNESTDGKAAFLPGGYKDFREGLLSGREFLFEITDFRGSRYTATFPETAVSEEMLRVSGGCKN